MKDAQVVGSCAVSDFASNPVVITSNSPSEIHCVRCTPERPEDEDLVQRCLAGDEHAWAELVRSYRGLVFTIAARFGGSRDDAADIMQAVCIEVLNSLSQLRSSQSFRSWLITVTVRQSMRWKRKNCREVPLETVEPDAKEISVAGDMTGRVLQGQQHRLLHQGVAQLPKRNAEMVRLLFFENPPLPYEEVARRLGLARGSIGFIRGRVLAKLRRILTEAGYDRRAMM